MLARVCSFMCLTITFAVTEFAGEITPSQEAEHYNRLLCSVLESSNSGDPEIRSNAVAEGLAYLDGEAADVLRVLLLAKENDPFIKESLVNQLFRSERKVGVVACLRNLAEISQSQNQKIHIQEAIHELETMKTTETSRVKSKEHKQPLKYSGPLSTINLKTLHDAESRTKTYRALASQPSRSSTEILMLFRSIEADAKRKEDLDRQITGGEDSRKQFLR